MDYTCWLEVNFIDLSLARFRSYWIDSDFMSLENLIIIWKKEKIVRVHMFKWC